MTNSQKIRVKRLETTDSAIGTMVLGVDTVPKELRGMVVPTNFWVELLKKIDGKSRYPHKSVK